VGGLVIGLNVAGASDIVFIILGAFVIKLVVAGAVFINIDVGRARDDVLD
jgi:hypothetical protein